MKVFVTGSTGLLGNNLVRTLEAAGHAVVGLVRSEEKGRNERSDRLLFHDTRMLHATGKEQRLGHPVHRTLHADGAGAAVVEDVWASTERTIR